MIFNIEVKENNKLEKKPQEYINIKDFGKEIGEPIEFFNENLGVEEKKIKLKNFIHGCDEDFKIKKISPKKLKEKLGQNFYFANTKVTLTEKKPKELYRIYKEKFI